VDEKKTNEDASMIDERKAEEQGASTEELREINESRGDGGNPEWWKNEGDGRGEVH
jgi:hypothetical protein